MQTIHRAWAGVFNNSLIFRFYNALGNYLIPDFEFLDSGERITAGAMLHVLPQDFRADRDQDQATDNLDSLTETLP